MILTVAYLVVVAIAVWAIWHRRETFQSRWDSPNTIAVVLFGLGALLDSPLAAMSEASFSLTGRYYVLATIGHVCYIVACAMGIKSIYLRLLPDADVDRLMRTRMAPAIVAVIGVMVVCFAASSRTASMSGEHLYLVQPDGWLTVYWLAYFSTLTTLFGIGFYGVRRLRTDPRSVMLDLLLISLALGALSCVAGAFGVVTHQAASVRLWAWPIGYAAIAAGAVAIVIAWRRRVQAMLSDR